MHFPAANVGFQDGDQSNVGDEAFIVEHRVELLPSRATAIGSRSDLAVVYTDSFPAAVANLRNKRC